MQIIGLCLGMFETNCYIVSGAEGDKCLLIDPAGDSARIIGAMSEKGLIPEAILLTHGHYDHILAVPALQEKWPNLPVYCHPADVPEEKIERDMGMEFPTVAAFSNLKSFVDGDSLRLAGFVVEVIGTPGHTPGSVVLLIEGAMFTGDTLFRRDIGRTDFAGGDEKAMMASLSRLAALPLKDAPVYAGHEGSTTLAEERKYNPYMRFFQEKQ